MLHNDTPKFTIPTSTSFSKSLRLHFEPEEDEPRGRRIVDSRTRRSRKIGDASVFFFFSLHAGKVNAYFWSGWLSRHPRILRHQHDKVRSRYLAHAAHLATYTRVRSRARHSFFLFFSSVGLRNRLVSGDGISNASSRVPETAENSNFLKVFELLSRTIVEHFVSFENCLGR